MKSSYLDKSLSSESYFEHIKTKSESHKSLSKVALDHFEKFLIGRFSGKTMKMVLDDSIKQKYENPQKHSKNLFSLLQEFINYLGVERRASTTVREYFNLVKKYLNWYGFEIYAESVKSRLNFTQKIQEEDYALTLDDVKLLLNGATSARRVLYFFLLSTGMRIQESLKLRKRDLDYSCDRVMVKIAGSYTKNKKPRKTFITKEAFWNLKQILKNKKDDDLIFTDNPDSLKAKHLEEAYFHTLRIKVGLVDRYETGIHKITLHSFRSWFITHCNRDDSSFGHALAGHGKYMKKYVRDSDSVKCEKFIKVENYISIFDRVDEDQTKRIESDGKRITDLEDKLDSIKEILERLKVS